MANYSRNNNHQQNSWKSKLDSVSSWRNTTEGSGNNNNNNPSTSSPDNWCQPKQRNNRNNRNNNSNNNRNNNRYSQYKDRQHVKQSIKQEFNISDYPELLEAYSEENAPKTNYLEKCKLTKQEDAEKCIIDVNDPQYWNNKLWIGPMIMKLQTTSGIWKTYIKEAVDNAKTFILPTGPISYSRDYINWFSTQEQTFSNEEWCDMKEYEQSRIDQPNHDYINELYYNDLNKSIDTYNEIGEINDCLYVHFQNIDYEKYLEELEDDGEEEISSDSEFDEDYISDQN